MESRRVKKFNNLIKSKICKKMKEDIRWHQRLNNYNKALVQLNNGVETFSERDLSDLERQGLIQSFEFTHELAWNVMKDFFYYQGNFEIRGSRDATREAMKFALISNGETWMDMIISRNKTTHTYDEEIARKIANLISKQYVGLLNAFSEKMRMIKDEK